MTNLRGRSRTRGSRFVGIFALANGEGSKETRQCLIKNTRWSRRQASVTHPNSTSDAGVNEGLCAILFTARVIEVDHHDPDGPCARVPYAMQGISLSLQRTKVTETCVRSGSVRSNSALGGMRFDPRCCASGSRGAVVAHQPLSFCPLPARGAPIPTFATNQTC